MDFSTIVHNELFAYFDEKNQPASVIGVVMNQPVFHSTLKLVVILLRSKLDLVFI